MEPFAISSGGMSGPTSRCWSGDSATHSRWARSSPIHPGTTAITGKIDCKPRLDDDHTLALFEQCGCDHPAKTSSRFGYHNLCTHAQDRALATQKPLATPMSALSISCSRLIEPHETGAGALLVGVTRADVVRLIGEVLDNGVSSYSVVPQPNRHFQDVTERAFREGLGLGHGIRTTEDLLLGIMADRHNLAARILDQLGVDYADVRGRVTAAIVRPRSRSPELEDDLKWLTKENTALRAAIAEMRPVFDAAVREARKGKPAQREWAEQIMGRVGAGEFGEPRRVL